jgi:16S rRNA processing protein RimM
MGEGPELIAIGKIVKPFGLRGEVKVLSLSDVPGRFQGLKNVTLEAPSGRTVSAAVTRMREERGGFVLGFDALSTPEEAAAFRGGFIKIPRTQSPALPEGQFYESDLIGMTVKDEAGRILGELQDILDTGANHVFAIRKDGREVLMPALRGVVASVDVVSRTMTVRWSQAEADEQV